MQFPNRETVEVLRLQYPSGTVIGVDDTGSIMVDWDNGSGLNVIYGVDRCKEVSNE